MQLQKLYPIIYNLYQRNHLQKLAPEGQHYYAIIFQYEYYLVKFNRYYVIFMFFYMNSNQALSLNAKQVSPAELPQEGNIAFSNENSPFVDEYYRLIRGSSFQPIDQDKLASVLLKEGIKYNREHAQEKIQIVLDEYSSNYEAIKINASYGFFCSSFCLINVDANKTFSHSAQSSAGAFGSVEKYLADGRPFAVKSVKFIEENFTFVLRQVVKEIFLLKIASALKIGPNARSIFGFDIVVYKNCFDFSMEFCEDVSDHGIPDTLQRSLSILHRINVVHMDVKPENIAFSRMYNDYVFIDFGLSRAIKEGIGIKSFTRFTGSFIFCCNQMLDLYTNDRAGLVDLYYNDAYSLHSTLQNILKKDPSINDHSQESYSQKNLSSIQLILKEKLELFIIGCESGYSEATLQCIVKKMSRPALLSFALTLPQKFNVIAYYKKTVRVADQWNGKLISFIQDFSSEDADKFFKAFNDRFAKIVNMNNENLFVGRTSQGFERLFEQLETKQYKFQVYCLALIQFIRINSHHNSFQRKIKACQVYSRQYLKKQIDQQEISLYRSVVKHIFNVALTSKQPQRYQILRNSIQTVVVLEIIPQNNFIEAYFAVFEWNIRNIRKVRLAFEFITSLQFVKEKYRKTYNYERLVKVFMTKLNSFINGIRFFVEDQQQKTVYKDIQLMIDHLQSPTPNSSTIQHILYKQIKFHKVEIKTVNQEIQMYLAAHELSNNKGTQLIFRSQQLFIIYTRIEHLSSYTKRFVYAHFAMFHAICLTEQLSKTQQIYAKFLRQFSPHEEHTYFKIYYLQQVNIIKLTFSITLSSKYHLHKIKPDDPQLIMLTCNQIFRILEWLIENTGQFHRFLRYILSFSSQIKLAIFSDRLYSFVKVNIDKIINITGKYHQLNQRHNDQLKIEITLFNIILDFVSEYEKENSFGKNERVIININQIVNTFYEVIKRVQCFQCKTRGLLELQMPFHYIKTDIIQDQQYFLSLIDTFIVILKNKEFRKSIFPLMTFLIRASLLKPELEAKYQIRDIFYEYIRQFNCFFYVLSNIRQCNLFIGMYIMIDQKYPDQMADFIFFTAQSLSNSNPTVLIDRFYYSLVQMAQYNIAEQYQIFKYSHDFIVEELLYCLKISPNPYLALYFAALLEVHIISDQASNMLRFICLSFNQLSFQAKKIILNHYYNYYEYYLPASKRKIYNLKTKYFKNCFDQIPMKKIVKAKLKIKTGPGKIFNNKCDRLKTFVERYHVNLKNVR